MNNVKQTMSRPIRARICAEAASLRFDGVLRQLRHVARLDARQREMLVALMLEREGLGGACARAGVGLGLVLSERRRNPAFHRALAAAEQQRRALLDMLLTDMAVRGLLAEGNLPASDARDKFLSGLAQTLLDRAAREAAPRPAASARPAPSRAAAPATDDDLQALLAETERRIAEAERTLPKHLLP